jgi:hypothetical protein
VRSKTTLIPDLWERDWTPLTSPPPKADDTLVDAGFVPGPVWKPLTVNEETGAVSYLMHIPPNWHDNVLDVHPTNEEGFVLAGHVTLGHPGTPEFGDMPIGNYCYRPPNILHGPARVPSVDGVTLFQRTDGELRIMRYEGDEFPHEHLQPITDEYKTWPVEWKEVNDTTAIPDEPATGGWTGTQQRWVWRNRETGGGCTIITIPPGWSGPGSPCRGSVEEFVIEGAFTAGGVEFPTWGYAYRHPGDAAGEYSSETGARVLCVWDEADEMAEA